jgi:hypothetical protein
MAVRHVEHPLVAAGQFVIRQGRIRRHLILEDWLPPAQSSAASTGPNTDRMGRSDRSRRTHEDRR